MREFRYLKAASKNGEKRDATNTVFRAFEPEELMRKNLFLVWSQRTTHFLVFKDVAEYEAWIAKKPAEEKAFCEVIFGNSPQRLRLDIDKATEDQLKLILVALKRVWRAQKPPAVASFANTGRLMLFKTGSGFHVVIDHVVDSAKTAAAFTEAIKRAVATSNPGLERLIDVAVYHAIQNFRIMGNSKPGDLTPKTALNEKPQLIDTLIVPRAK